MTRKLSTRLAAAHGFLAKLWKLTAPYCWSEERWSARGLLAIVIGGNVLLVYLAKLLNEVERAVLQRSGGQERRGVLGRAPLLRVSRLHLHRGRGVPALVPPDAADPLAPLADRGLLPRLAGRADLLPHGAVRRRGGQSGAADRGGLQRVHRADADHRARPALARSSRSSPSPRCCGASPAASRCRSSAGSRFPAT